LATGTGATVSQLPDAREVALIVITPKAAVSTVDAYAALSSPSLTTMKTAPILSNSHQQANLRDSDPWVLRAEGIEELSNDFESVIFDNEPETRRAKAALLEAGALNALLAGSGSSVFGIFADQKAQLRAFDEIQTEAGWRMFPCVTVSRNDYSRAFNFEV
jgi:4-diphosphocytidyl-2-C-methyl-D-erythritol kinase